jgi:hypothetical protein
MRDYNSQIVTGGLPQSDTIYAAVLTANTNQIIPVPSTIGGALTSGTFQVNETVTQTGTGATGKLLVVPSGSPTVLVLGAVTGKPNNFGTWVGQTSEAIWTPSALPVAPNSVLFSVSGSNDFYMLFANQVIAIPASTGGASPELNPLIRNCAGKQYVSLVSPANCNITMAFYQ